MKNGLRLLDIIKNYKGISALTEDEVTVLCDEIRALMIDVTLKNGGHLGGSLGAVELCVSLLRVFDPERDRIIFDVGHQAYAYKMLTDRLEAFPTLRRKGGISGFPRRSESKYDAFDTGHSSTSISAALGYARARDMLGEKREVVAVIGDGALLNGLAFEAMNNVSSCGSKITIILNDNKMSIGPRIGGMASHLARLAVSAPYTNFKRFIKDRLDDEAGARCLSGMRKVRSKIKSLLHPANIFEEMDISYWGPFDGHDTKGLRQILELSKRYEKPLLIHVITRKGKGCPDAEAAPSKFHGVGSGTVIGPAAAVSPPSASEDWSRAAADTAEGLAASDCRVVAITAAMEDGTRLSNFKRRFAGRFFDVGIAEGHMLTFAAGLAAGGMRPIAFVYSTFLQRAVDQLVHDVSMQRLPVLISVDRAGLTGEDGETHQGLLDIAWARAVPGLTVASPRDRADLRFMMEGWLAREIPMLIRYPKGTAPESVERDGPPTDWGRAEVLRRGSRVCLIGLGSTVEMCLRAADMMRSAPTVADLRFISPIDRSAVEALLREHEIVVTAEDGYCACGVGEAVAAIASEARAGCRVLRAGVPPKYVAHASRSQQLEECGLTPEGIVSLVEESEQRI